MLNPVSTHPARLADDERAALLRGLTRASARMGLALEQLFAPSVVEVGAVQPMDAASGLPGGLVPHDLLCIAFDMRGPLHGRMLLLANAAAGVRTAAAMLGTSHSGVDDDVLAALMELGNIAASHFLNGLAAVSGMTLLPTVPMVTTDPADEVRRCLELGGGLAFAAPCGLDLPNGSARAVFVVAPAVSSLSVLTIALRARAR